MVLDDTKYLYCKSFLFYDIFTNIEQTRRIPLRTRISLLYKYGNRFSVMYVAFYIQKYLFLNNRLSIMEAQFYIPNIFLENETFG